MQPELDLQVTPCASKEAVEQGGQCIPLLQNAGRGQRSDELPPWAGGTDLPLAPGFSDLTVEAADPPKD